MEPLLPTNLETFLDTALSRALARLLGSLIGAERQYRERTASRRTNVLVALGAAACVDMGIQTGGPDGAMQLVANVDTGVGFLGAGLILKGGANIRGLNTAATVWCSAAVGASAGANPPVQAVALTVFVLVCNTVLRPIGKLIDRLPTRDQSAEARYQVSVTVPDEGMEGARGTRRRALGSRPSRACLGAARGADGPGGDRGNAGQHLASRAGTRCRRGVAPRRDSGQRRRLDAQPGPLKHALSR
jgi:putative Mg2+ transporter-C (MgtC) family protein